MMDYIDGFLEKIDVVEDIKPYLKLFNKEDDIANIKDRMRDRVIQVE